MTEVEVLLYCLEPKRPQTDPFNAMVLQETLDNLPVEDRIRLGKRRYDLDTV